jgi:uncharacterized protein DUF4402
VKTRKIRTGVEIAAIAAILVCAPLALHAASATALVSATVLGPAETDIASGAVTMSKVSEAGFGTIERQAARRSGAYSDARTLAVFTVKGGFNASYAVTLPSSVTITNSGSEGAQICVSGFHTTNTAGRLAADGSGTIVVGASLSIPAEQTPGTYAGNYPVTIAYN